MNTFRLIIPIVFITLKASVQIQILRCMNKNNIEKSSQDKLGVFLSKWRNKRVIKEIKSPFLDLACGDNRIVEQMDGGIGIDVINYGKADIIVKNFNVLPFKSDTFKTVTIVGSLNYFENPKGVLMECERILVRGGILVITILDPQIGRLWHFIREPWAQYPGFTFNQILHFIESTKFELKKKTRFMFGLNNLYVFRKR